MKNTVITLLLAVVICLTFSGCGSPAGAGGAGSSAQTGITLNLGSGDRAITQWPQPALNRAKFCSELR